MKIETRNAMQNAAMQIARFKKFISKPKTTLGLLVLGQAYTLYLWQMQTYNARDFTSFVSNFIVSAVTAFAIDGATVHIAFSKKEGRLQWSLAVIASILLTAISVAIASTALVNAEHNDAATYLHAAFPIAIFAYSWYSAVVMPNEELKIAHAEVQNASALTIEDVATAIAPLLQNAVEDMQNANTQTNARLDTMQLQINAMQSNAMQSSAVVQSAYACPKCNAPLKQRAYYNAKNNGYCGKCKES